MPKEVTELALTTTTTTTTSDHLATEATGWLAAMEGTQGHDVQLQPDDAMNLISQLATLQSETREGIASLKERTTHVETQIQELTQNLTEKDVLMLKELGQVNENIARSESLIAEKEILHTNLKDALKELSKLGSQILSLEESVAAQITDQREQANNLIEQVAGQERRTDTSFNRVVDIESQIAGFQKRLTVQNEHANSLGQRMNAIDERANGHDQAVVALTSRADAHDQSVTALTVRAYGHDQAVVALTGRADAHDQAEAALTGRVNGLDQSVAALTNRADAHDQSVAALDVRANSHDQDVVNLTNRANGLDQSIAALTNRANGHDQSVAALNVRANDHDQDVVNLTNHANGHDQTIANMQTQIANLQQQSQANITRLDRELAQLRAGVGNLLDYRSQLIEHAARATAAGLVGAATYTFFSKTHCRQDLFLAHLFTVPVLMTSGAFALYQTAKAGVAGYNLLSTPANVRENEAEAQ